MYLLWQYENLHDKDAEENETSTGHVILECWQCSGSVLKEEKGHHE
jgi:hypothetical protein